MSIGRIEYTSCPDGTEGISGFQVRASTPGVAKGLLDEALAEAVYEPSYDLPSSPDAAELAGFPVSFGVTRSEQGVAVYRSNYVGRDHTGRWGNYFAQVLAFDSPAELDALLPIDLWESPLWEARSESVGTLPPVTGVAGAAGPLTTSATAGFLTDPARADRLPGLVAAVRRTLHGGDRLVVVVEDSTTAAGWIAAISRSLPRTSALQLSFSTWTAQPQSHRAHLTFVTPGVSMPNYGAFRRIDLTSPARPEEQAAGDYDRIVAASWRDGGPAALLAVVDGSDVPDDSLDALARLAVLAGLLAGEPPADETDLLDTLRVADTLVPDWTGAAWRETGQLVAGGRVRVSDAGAWGDLLSRTVPARIPGPVVAAYVSCAVEALLAQRSTEPWMPVLDDVTTAALAADHFAPALMSGTRNGLAEWLAHRAHRSLRDAVLAVLEERLASVTQLQDAVARLPLPAAQFVVGHPSSSPRLVVFAELVTVRERGADPVPLLTSPALAGFLTRDQDWAALPDQLWPDEAPSTAGCLRLFQQLPPAVTSRLRLTGLALRRLRQETEAGEFDSDALPLAVALTSTRDGRDHPDIAVAAAIQSCVYFEGVTGFRSDVGPNLEVALSLGDAVPVRLRERVWTAVTGWLVRRAPDTVESYPMDQINAVWPVFFEYFCAHAPVDVKHLRAESVASLVVVWFEVGRATTPNAGKVSRRLLQTVLPAGLRKADRKTLDLVGRRLPDEAVSLFGRGFAPEGGWVDWWGEWRAQHESQSLIARLRRRTGSR